MFHQLSGMQLLDKGALLVIIVASFLSLVCHWQLGCVAPLNGVAGLLTAARSAHYHVAFSEEDVLQRGAIFWQGSSAAAAHHEALGRVYVHSGLDTKALIEFQNAGESILETQLGIRAKLAAAVETARIHLRNGLTNEALDAVSETISASTVGVSDIRSRALHILVQTVLKSKPSDEEAAGVMIMLQECLKMLAKNGADSNAQALLHEDSASLAALRGAWKEVEVDLLKALKLRDTQRSQVEALRVESRTGADDIEDLHLAKLHLRLADGYYENSRLERAAEHSSQAEKTIWARRVPEPEERLGLAGRALLLAAKVALARHQFAEAARAAKEAAVVASFAEDASLPWAAELRDAVASIQGSLDIRSNRTRGPVTSKQPVQNLSKLTLGRSRLGQDHLGGES